MTKIKGYVAMFAELNPDLATTDATTPARTTLKSILINVWQHIVRWQRRVRYAVRYAGQAVIVDPSTHISTRSVIRVNGGGSVTIGRHCEIHDFAMIMTYGGDIVFGDHCSLNPFCVVYGHGGVRIGNGVRIATQTVIVPANHNTGTDEQPLHTAGVSMQGIEIGDHVWLGAGTKVLDGTRIGHHAVVAAGAVVTRSVADGAVVGGVPARILSTRHHDGGEESTK